MSKWIVAQDGRILNANKIIAVYPVVKVGIAEPIRYVKNSYGDDCVVSQDYVTLYAVMNGLEQNAKLWRGKAGSQQYDFVHEKIVRFLATPDDAVDAPNILNLETMV